MNKMKSIKQRKEEKRITERESEKTGRKRYTLRRIGKYKIKEEHMRPTKSTEEVLIKRSGKTSWKGMKRKVCREKEV